MALGQASTQSSHHKRSAQPWFQALKYQVHISINPKHHLETKKKVLQAAHTMTMTIINRLWNNRHCRCREWRLIMCGSRFYIARHRFSCSCLSCCSHTLGTYLILEWSNSKTKRKWRKKILCIVLYFMRKEKTRKKYLNRWKQNRRDLNQHNQLSWSFYINVVTPSRLK